MAIVIDNVSRPDSKKTYYDLHLDLQIKKVSASNSSNNVVNGNDIILDTDYDAVRNSILNILSQKRYTNAHFDTKIRGMIGQSLSELAGVSLGSTIKSAIQQFEPRVSVEKVSVAVNLTKQSYVIALHLKYAGLKEENIFFYSLDNKGNFSKL